MLFFETISGFTTTGASIVTDIEALPHGILFWRSLTHLLGGMGILVLTVAVLPVFGIGGMAMFNAEAAGITTDKLHPRNKRNSTTSLGDIHAFGCSGNLIFGVWRNGFV